MFITYRGDSLKIEVYEVVYFVARDGKTSAIVVYVEHLSDAGGFVSGARSASRNKP
ncbi:hypothetical protein ACVGWV_00020, partial [Enterobacter asburiae]